MAKKTSRGEWITATGQTVPPKFVQPLDKKRDALVEKLVKAAEEVSGRLAALRAMANDAVEQFLTTAAAEHGLKLNEGGNYTFTGFSGHLRVEIKVGKFIDFDERLTFAKQKIDQCLERWSEGANGKLKTVVFDAFKVDERGRIDTKRILGLRRLKIDDVQWKEAMELISQAVMVTGSKEYMSFYRRDEHGQWQSVCLDMARIG